MHQYPLVKHSPLILLITIALSACQGQPPPTTVSPSPTFISSPITSETPPVLGESKLLMVSEQGRNQEIYLINLDGTGLVNLTNNPTEDVNPVWSPDGQFIAFRSIRNGQEQIYIMRSDGGQVTPVPETGPLDVPVGWSPDGQYLLLLSQRNVNAEIYALKPNGSESVNLTRHPANDWFAAWSPDGSRIALVSDRNSEAGVDISQIYVMNVNGKETVQLTDFPGGVLNPVWSPDGSEIAFSVTNERRGADVYAIQADGGNVRQLTDQPGWNTPQTWSPDGSQIVISQRLNDGSSKTFMVSPKNGITTLLPIESLYVRWQPVSNLASSIQLPAPEEEPRQPSTLVLVNGTLIDGTGSEPVHDAAILIQDGRIVAVGPTASMTIPAEAQIIDLQGGTMLPGFINAHVHQALEPRNLAAWAQAGVTTVRSLGELVGGLHHEWNSWVETAEENDTPPFLFAYRDATLDHPLYARLVAAGPLVSVPDGYPISVWGPGIDLAVTSPDDARQKVEALLDAGADVIKISLETGPRLTQEEVRAIVDIAHEQGTIVTAHVSTTEHLSEGLAAGIDDAAHMATDRWSDDLLDQMVTNDVYLVPTLAVWGPSCGQDCLDNLRRFVAAGGKVALGDDYGNPGIELGMPIREMELMQQGGMTPMQIILAGTKHASHVCNLEADLGTLEPGKIADILVVNGDPLEDIHMLTNVRLVIHSGVVIRQAQSSP